MRMAVVGVLYTIVGVLTGELARSAASIQVRDRWRLAGWVLSAVVFVGHLAYERLRAGAAPAASAARTAAAVAIGAFLLAAAGPVRSYWGTERFWRVTVLSLVVWPVIAGVPAFFVALAGGAIHRRFFGTTERS